VTAPREPLLPVRTTTLPPVDLARDVHHGFGLRGCRVSGADESAAEIR
jgi:hypothetical protein